MSWQIAFWISLYVLTGFKLAEKHDLTPLELFVCMLLWPLFILVSIYEEVQSLTKRRN